MQYKDENTEKLIRVFGEILNEERGKLQKSLNLWSNEYGLDPGNISRIENGKIEVKFTMLWRSAEALDKPLSSIIKLVEERLGKDFHIISK